MHPSPTWPASLCALSAAFLPAQQFASLQPLQLAPGEQVLSVADYDADGLDDLLVSTSSTLQLLRNLGDGHFTRQPAAALAFPIEAMAWGDIDGDGDRDLVIMQQNWQRPILLRIDHGVPTDVTNTNLPPFQNAISSFALLDADADGDLDIVALQLNQTPLLLGNDGHGVFTPSSLTLPPQPPSASHLLAADLDGDGRTDLLLLSGLALQCWMQRPGGFVDETGQRLPAVASPGVREFVVGDVDTDGDLDLFIGHPNAVGLFLLANNGNGVFAIVSGILMPGGLPRVLLDFDGDGDLDFVALDDIGHNQLLRNDGTGTFSYDTGQWGQFWLQGQVIGAVDLDGDAFADLAAVNGPVDGIYLLRNVGGRALQPWNAPLKIAPTLVFDSDGDGDIDLLRDDVLVRNDNGSFGFGPGIPSARIAGDVDGDGDLDVLAGSQAGLRVWRNIGGTFVPDPATFTGDAYGALGDIDGDGDLDLILSTSHYPTSIERLFTNDGHGVFTDVTVSQLPSFGDFTTAVKFADMDADGDLDLIYGNSLLSTHPASPPLRLLRNQGNGVFVDATQLIQITPGGRSSWRPIPVQLDGDPELEIVCNEAILDRVGGLWQEVTAAVLPPHAGSLSLDAAADIDDDGDADLIGYVSPTYTMLLFNDGTGHFTDVTASRGSVPLNWRLVDIDGDGDLDAIDAGFEHHLLFNMQRQLLMPLPPRTGHPFDLGFVAEPGYGTGSHLALVGLGLRRLPTATPTPWGTFLLDLGSGSVVAAMVSNGGSTASSSIPVPALAALRGVRVYLQGLEVSLPSGNFHCTNFLGATIE